MFFLTALSSIFCYSAFTQDNPDLKKIEMCIMQQHPGEVTTSMEINEEKLILRYNQTRNVSQAWDWDYVAGTVTIYFDLIENVYLKEIRKGKRCHVILKMKNEQEKIFVFNNYEIARDLDEALHNVLDDLNN